MGGGETGALMRSCDWSTSPLGDPAAWPQPLQTAVGIMLRAGSPLGIYWGSDLVLLYNDAWRQLIGDKHPAALGRPAREVFPEIWEEIEPMFAGVLAGHGPARAEDRFLPLSRDGRTQDAWFSYGAEPIPLDDGSVGGILNLATETTARVLAERRQALERERLSRMFEQAPGFMAMLEGPAHRIVLTNPAYMKLVGHRDVVGKTVAEALPDAVAQGYLELLDQVYATGETFASSGARYAVQAEPGGPIYERYVDFVFQPVTDAGGQVSGIFVEGVDVTDKVLADAAQRESQERLIRVLDHVPVGVGMFDAEGRFTLKNPRLSDLIGDLIPSRDKADGRRWEGFDPSGRAVAPHDYPGARVLRGEDASAPVDFRRLDADAERWLRVSAVPLHARDGALSGGVTVVQDVTDERRVQNDLRASEEFNRRVLQASADCIKVLDLDGRLEFMSEGGMCALEVEDFGAIEGACWPNFWQGEEHAKALAAIDEAKRGGTGRFQGFRPTMKGRPRWWDVAITPINGADGRPEKLLSVSRDITAAKEADERLREVSRRHDAILANTREAVFLMDHRQHCVYANAAAEKLTGYTFDEMQGRPLHDVVHHRRPDGSHYPLDECPIDRAFPECAQMSGEELFVHKDGSFYPVAFTASPVLNDEGRPIGTVIEARNIAVEKAREAALQEESRTLETLNRTGAAIAAELDLERVVQMVTDAGVELTGAKFGAFFYNVLNEAGEAFMLYTLSGAQRADFENFGMPRATAVFGPTFRNEGVVRSDDITADARYGQSAPYRGMPKGHLPVRSYLAVPVTSRSGKVIGGLFFGHPDPARFTERHEKLMVGLAAQAAIAMDNAHLYQEAQREIEERRRAQDELRQLNETLEARVASRTADIEFLYNSAPIPLHSQSPDGVLISVSDRWLEFMGYDSRDQVIGRRAVEFLTPESARRQLDEYWPRLLAKGSADDVEYQVVKRSGEIADVLISSRLDYDDEGRFVRTMGAVVDITERKRTEGALRQSQKMEAVGQLVSGLAHDFNNLLGAVVGSLDLIRRRADDPARVRRFAEAGLQAAERGSKLTGQLLAFSRSQRIEVRPLIVCDVIEGVRDMLARTLGPMIELEFDLNPCPVPVLADATQVEMTILNLAINARDAMPKGGRLRIATATRRIESDPELEPGDFVELTVADTGSGMDEATLRRAMEPFFTTKPIGKGTGLGLAQVYGSARQSGGTVRIESRLGHGTTVRVLLPRTTSVAHAPPDPHKAAVTSLRPSATVLVIDDDADLRGVLVHSLDTLGYKALEASDGPSGLHLLKEQCPDVMVVDFAMPGMNGAEVAKMAREQRPGLPIVITSGYADSEAIDQAVGKRVAVLRKPFRIDELLGAVGEVLKDA